VHWFPESEQLRADILDARRPNSFSVGYDWTGVVRRETRSDGLHLFFAWTPFEASVLTASAPADSRAGLYRMKSSIDELLQLALSGSRHTEFDPDSYRLTRALDFSQELSGYEREVQSAAPRFIAGNRMVGDRFLPFAALAPKCRDMQATIFPSGGAFVPEQMLPIIGPLLNRTAAVRLGSPVIPGCQGNIILPRATTAAPPAILSEIAPSAENDLVTDQVAASPHRASFTIRYSRQLDFQAPSTEVFLRREALRAMNVLMDRLVFAGGQNRDEPIGLANRIGVGSMVWGGAASWPGVLQAVKSLTDANADYGPSLGWAVSSATRNRWTQIPRLSGYPVFLMDDSGKVNGFPSVTTQNLSDTNASVFGNWEELAILLWGDGMSVTSDRVTQAAQGKVALTFHLWLDFLIEHPQAFNVSADSGAQ